MINNFYNISIGVDIIPDILDRHLSPAEVLESLCTNFKSYEAAIEHMKRNILMPIDMTKSIMFSVSPETSTNNLHISDNDSETDDESTSTSSELDEEFCKKNELIKCDKTNSTTPLVKIDFDYQFNNISSIDTKQRKNIMGTSIIDLLNDGYGPLDLMNDNLLG